MKIILSVILVAASNAAAFAHPGTFEMHATLDDVVHSWLSLAQAGFIVGFAATTLFALWARLKSR